MKCCAVFDTNVLVAALLSKRDDSPTVRVIQAMISGEFIPLYHEDILAKYEDVLHRKRTKGDRYRKRHHIPRKDYHDKIQN